MKYQRIMKNAKYARGYGCSYKKFKKLVKSSPDNNIKRIKGRELKTLWRWIGYRYFGVMY